MCACSFIQRAQQTGNPELLLATSRAKTRHRRSTVCQAIIAALLTLPNAMGASQTVGDGAKGVKIRRGGGHGGDKWAGSWAKVEASWKVIPLN